MHLDFDFAFDLANNQSKSTAYNQELPQLNKTVFAPTIQVKLSLNY